MNAITFALLFGSVAHANTVDAEPSASIEPSASKEQAQTSDITLGFEGPENIRRSTTRNTIENQPFLDSWYQWKADLAKDHGFNFGVEFNSTYLKATDTLDDSEDYAWGSISRVSTSWDLYGRGTGHTGTLMFLFEYANNVSGAVPSDYLIESVGYVGISGVNYNDDKFRLNTLYWDQKFDDGNYEIYAGFLDISDYVDVFPLTSPWNDYGNYMFSIGSGALDLTTDASLGIVGAAWLTDSVYAMAGIVDQKSDPTDPLEGFDTFFNDREHFKHVELGWTGASKEAWFLNNVHLTLWHSDKRKDFGIEDGWGGVFSANFNLNDKWLTFFRAGFADDAGSLLKRSVSIGAGYTPKGMDFLMVDSQFGVGVNWGRPNDSLFGVDLDDQYGVESYYRLQVTKEIAITPSLQYLVDPALNPSGDNEFMFGLRIRAAL